MLYPTHHCQVVLRNVCYLEFGAGDGVVDISRVANGNKKAEELTLRNQAAISVHEVDAKSRLTALLLTFTDGKGAGGVSSRPPRKECGAH